MYYDLKFSKEELKIILSILKEYEDEYELEMKKDNKYLYLTIGELMGRIECFLRGN